MVVYKQAYSDYSDSIRACGDILQQDYLFVLNMLAAVFRAFRERVRALGFWAHG